MAWDFSTEPEFQEQLDWMRTFVDEEIAPLALLDLAFARHDGGRAGALADVAAAASGVAAQRAADGAGNADQILQPGQSLAHGSGDDLAEFRAAAGRDDVVLHGDVRERRLA